MSTPSTSLDTKDPRLNKVGPWGTLKQRASQGQLGSAPVFIGLIILVIIFSALKPVFYGGYNLVSLTQQIAPLGMISLGITLVLLLGEIDLSAASVSGLAAACVAVTSVSMHWPMTLAVIFSALVGSAVGLFQGTIIAKLGLPSFVVTLAGFLAWQGLQLYVLGDLGTINLTADGWLIQLGYNWFLKPWESYALIVVTVVVMVATRIMRSRRRTAAGLSGLSPFTIYGSPVILGVCLAVAVAFLDRDRGVSVMFLLLLLAMVAVNWVLLRTRPGRALFAVGGNDEAARRSGINVTKVRIVVFVTGSTFAAIGGMLFAARIGSASQASGSGDILINAIAAAVIGGVSLFGGRGSVWGTLLGLFVIGVIANGLNLLNYNASIKYIITGGVLLLAVVLDGVARRGQKAK